MSEPCSHFYSAWRKNVKRKNQNRKLVSKKSKYRWVFYSFFFTTTIYIKCIVKWKVNYLRPQLQWPYPSVTLFTFAFLINRSPTFKKVLFMVWVLFFLQMHKQSSIDRPRRLFKVKITWNWEDIVTIQYILSKRNSPSRKSIIDKSENPNKIELKFTKYNNGYEKVRICRSMFLETISSFYISFLVENIW